MRMTEALDKIQKTRRFQFLTFCGLLLTYPIVAIPLLFKVLLDIDEETLDLWFK